MASSRYGALILMDLQIASPEPMMGRRKEYPAVLMIDQNDCMGTAKLNNELMSMSLSTNSAPFCFFVEVERVNLVEPDGRLINPLPPLPREVDVARLAA
jgi:hypothetical protein